MPEPTPYPPPPYSPAPAPETQEAPPQYPPPYVQPEPQPQPQPFVPPPWPPEGYEPPPPPEPVDEGPWFYAQLDAEGVCTAVTQAAGPIDAERAAVRLDSLDSSRLGCKWTPHGEDGSPGFWCEPEATPVRQLTPLDFLQRFTDAEAVKIDLASIGDTVPAASVRRLLQLINAAPSINLDSARTQAGVRMLVQAGLIEAARANEILGLEPAAPNDPAEG